jgi:hypothetical protein
MLDSIRVKALVTVHCQRGWIVYSEPFASSLQNEGYDTATAFLDMPGEIVSGHAERHVRRVTLTLDGLPRVCFLKCEHIIGWRTRLRNWLAGFGAVSRSEREAKLLQLLQAEGLNSPNWLAYGEDGEGRAFLLIEQLVGSELREQLSEASGLERLAIGTSVAKELALFHQHGFSPTDLAAKHLFLSESGVTFIDWQTAPWPNKVQLDDVVQQWATLHASVAPELFSSRERVSSLRSYCALTGNDSKQLARQILESAKPLMRRSSIRDQLAKSSSTSRLVWLAGEAICVIPELADHWPNPAESSPFYRAIEPTRLEWASVGNFTGVVKRYHEFDPIGRAEAALLGKSWRSTGATAGRILMHLQRHRIPAPRLLAFGQRMTTRCHSESFVYFAAEREAVSVPIRLADRAVTAKMRQNWLRQAGLILRLLHDSGARLARRLQPVYTIGKGPDAAVLLSGPDVVQLQKVVSEQSRLQDLLWLNRNEWPTLRKMDRRAVIAGYLQPGPVNYRRSLFRTAV